MESTPSVTSRTSGDAPVVVSVVTPSLNCANFIEETICSVLDQDYPHIQYIVMDGGSTDGTMSILERYSGRLQSVSEPDGGQADAINRGFQRASGEILAFLNADDTYLPGAVTAVVSAFQNNPEAGVLYGNAWYTGQSGDRIGAYPVGNYRPENLARRCFICQPAAFIRRKPYEAVGGLNPSLRYAFDYDLWIRMSQHWHMVKLDRALATSRLHPAAKTSGETAAAMLEAMQVLQEHYKYVPFNWLYGYGHVRITGESPVLARPRGSLTSAAFSAMIGMRYNWRHPLQYGADILATAREGIS